MSESQNKRSALLAVNTLHFLPKFVSWPPGERAKKKHFKVCLLGEDRSNSFIKEELKNGMMRLPDTLVEEVDEKGSLGECQMLYVREIAAEAFKNLQEKIKSLPILTVSWNSSHVIRTIVKMQDEPGEVSLRIDLDLLKQARLSASSDLLSISIIEPNENDPSVNLAERPDYF